MKYTSVTFLEDGSVDRGRNPVWYSEITPAELGMLYEVACLAGKVEDLVTRIGHGAWRGHMGFQVDVLADIDANLEAAKKASIALQTALEGAVIWRKPKAEEPA